MKHRKSEKSKESSWSPPPSSTYNSDRSFRIAERELLREQSAKKQKEEMQQMQIRLVIVLWLVALLMDWQHWQVASRSWAGFTAWFAFVAPVRFGMWIAITVYYGVTWVFGMIRIALLGS